MRSVEDVCYPPLTVVEVSRYFPDSLLLRCWVNIKVRRLRLPPLTYGRPLRRCCRPDQRRRPRSSSGGTRAGARDDRPLSRPPAATAASWKAFTLARSAAAKATWTGWPGSPWPIQKSGLPEPRGSRARLHDQLVAEWGEGFLVETLAPLEVRDGDPYVIQHRSPPMAPRTKPTPVGLSIPVARPSATANLGEFPYLLKTV